MTTSTAAAASTLSRRVLPVLGRGSRRVVERNFLVYRRSWIVFLTGFLEPVFYLFSIGIGVGGLIGDFTLGDGTVIGYAAFVAPGMLASSAMNGALFDATYGIFFRFKYAKLYDAMLATPLRPGDIAAGEISWALLRGTCYSTAFVAIMAALGLIGSWWGILTVPAAMLIGFAFGGAGMALTTYMKSWQDFEYIQLAIIPMFLFSATFYPLSTYPTALQWVVSATPLYQGVVLCRDLTTGRLGPELLIAVGYLAVMGAVGLRVAGHRLGVLLLR
ncbi:MAG: ABC transporter permease [Nocardioidaceae bacterium]